MNNTMYKYACLEVYSILKQYNLEGYFSLLEKKIIYKVIEDLKMLVSKNPAIKNFDIAIFNHLGFKSILNYRVANSLQLINNDFLELFSLKISEDCKLLTGVEIHPLANIEGGGSYRSCDRNCYW